MVLEIGLIAFLAVGIAGIRIVKQQDVAIVKTFGKYAKTLHPGLNWIIPGIQSIRGVVDMRINEIRASVDVKTLDNMFVFLPVSIMIVPTGENIANAYYKLTDPNEQIKSLVLNSVRSIASGMALEDLFSDRETIVNQVKHVIGTKLSSYGYKIEAVLVDQPSVSEDVQHSFNRVIAAKREAEAATQEGLAVKIKAIALAEAEAESQRVRARGMADAREILAQGLNDSVKALDSTHISSEHIVATLVQLNKLDVMREIGQKGNTILLDLNSDNTKMDALLGLLGQKINKEN